MGAGCVAGDQPRPDQGSRSCTYSDRAESARWRRLGACIATCEGMLGPHAATSGPSPSQGHASPLGLRGGTAGDPSPPVQDSVGRNLSSLIPTGEGKPRSASRFRHPPSTARQVPRGFVRFARRGKPQTGARRRPPPEVDSTARPNRNMQAFKRSVRPWPTSKGSTGFEQTPVQD